MSLIELSTHTTEEAVDWIKTLLAPIDELKIKVKSFNKTDFTQSESEWKVTVYLHLNNDRRVQTRINQIINALSTLRRTEMISEIQIAEINQQSFGEVDFDSLVYRIGRFVVISPGVNNYSTNTNEILLTLVPSFAFGSGLHPATRLCLTLLDRHLTPGMNTLDLGCGSGILSVAMAKLGAQVLAIDNDPIAVAATQAAIDLNHVTQVTVMPASLGNGGNLGHWMGGDVPKTTIVQPTAQFDLIVANILARIHITLATDYCKALRPTNHAGLLITAGFDADYAADIDSIFTQAGLQQIDCERSGEWVAFVHQRDDR